MTALVRSSTGSCSGVVVAAVVLAVSGCGGPTASADCSSQIRTRGVVYTSYGHTDRPATRHATADSADCHDTGEDAAGSVFPDDPRQVTTWTFEGYPPEKVLGVRFDEDSFAVFVAESVPRGERDRIYEALDRPAP